MNTTTNNVHSSNQCTIRAILDEYYEGGSYEEADYESDASKLSSDPLTFAGSTQSTTKFEDILHTVSPSSNEVSYEPPHIKHQDSESNNTGEKYDNTKHYNNEIVFEDKQAICGQHSSTVNDDLDCRLNRPGTNASLNSSEVRCESSQQNVWEEFGDDERSNTPIDSNMQNDVILKDATNTNININVNVKDGKPSDAPFPPSHSTQNVSKPKKPFLKKGSRKEPSSLQRVKDDVIKNGMRFKNEIQTKTQSDTCNPDKKLEHLERMQQEQIENLEKRMERRDKAREEIRRSKLENNKDKKVVSEKNMERKKQHISCDQLDVPESSSSEESSADECSSDEETECDSSDEEPISSKEGDKHDTIKHKQPKRITGKSPAQGKKTIQRNRLDKRGRCNKNNGSTGFKSAGIEEQWQVIKSMRKRQEAALRSAEKEREEARSWANNERENVQKWAEQQRSLIKKERKRVMNDTMAAQRNKRQEGLEERAAVAAAKSQKQLRTEIETLTAALQKQKIDNDAAKARSRLNEKRLRDIISERDKKIDALNNDIEELNAKYTKMEKERNELSKFQLEKKKKKRKKHSTHCPHVDDKVDTNSPVETSQDVPAVQHSPKQDVGPLDVDKEDTVEEGGQVSECDKEAIRVISTRQDLIGQPTENWLQKHLQGGFHDQSISEGLDASYTTPVKGKKYNPQKYSMTPQSSSINNNQDLSFQSTRSFSERNVVDEENTRERRVVTYRNGTQKEILPDGTAIVRFTNGDTKTTYSNIGIVVYYYAETRTSHTSHPDGLEIFEFASGQTERHYPNGRKEVHFPDGTQQVFLPNGDKVNSFPDGVNVMESNVGKKIIQQTFNN